MKKNTKLIKKALKKLNTGKVRLCGGELKNGSSYCAVGFLTAFAAEHEPKKVEKVLSENLFDSYNEETMEWEEHPYTLVDLFADGGETDIAIDVCERAYGLDHGTLSEVVALNDDEYKTSRVERLRLRLRAVLGEKKAEKALRELR